MGLIAELNRLQARRGYLAEDDLRDLATRLRLPLYRVNEVVSFYPHFRKTPPPRSEVLVCRDVCCFLAGGEVWSAKVRQLLARERDVEVREVSCLGRCEKTPAALLNGVAIGDQTPERIAQLSTSVPSPFPPRFASQSEAVGEQGEGGQHPERRRWRLDPYGDGGERFSVAKRFGCERAAKVIAALKASGLRGMGGAGFSTGVKWEIVRNEKAEPKYVIVNADESEPGTFKDRVILEELPHLVVEGMCVAARVVGAERGVIYLRHEYEHVVPLIERAINEAGARGLLGDGFAIEIFLSPGGYILGEETALLEALEDKRGEPRNKPPYPGSHGLWGRPTLINNVETLAMVPTILARGAEWWKAQGIRGHHGLKVMAVSGHIAAPGVYEIPMGTTVAELIEMAGWVAGKRRLKAFAPGGASSNFLPADKADVEIDFASIQAAGSMLGSGALVVVAEGTEMVPLAANIVRFFRNESCGKCVPCRAGTEKVVRMLDDNLGGSGALLEILPGLEEALAQTSICGLGQVALNPLTSVVRHWPEEVKRHLTRTS